jgi:hypothetical protein
MSTAPLVSTPYLGDAVTQLDGTTYQYSDCGCAGSAELADCSSLGFWRPTPARIRNLSGDTSGGVSYPDLAAAVKKATYGEVVLTPLFWVPPSTLDDIMSAPRVTGVSILCSVTINTPFRTSPTYTGRHFIVLGARRYATVTRSDGTKYQQKQGLIMDPGHSTTYLKWQWWPWALIVKAATASTGNGTVNLMQTRDLGGVSRTAKANGGVHTTPSTTASLIGTVAKDKTYTVAGTVRGGGYAANGHICKGWSKRGTGQFVANISLR